MEQSNELLKAKQSVGGVSNINSLALEEDATAQSLSKQKSLPTHLHFNLKLNKQTSTSNETDVDKGTSLQFRHSQLSDSGAESGDNDDQIRLLPTPSIRSHKFIIIPATSTYGMTSQLHATKSSTSLTSPQKLPQTRHSTNILKPRSLTTSTSNLFITPPTTSDSIPSIPELQHYHTLNQKSMTLRPMLADHNINTITSTSTTATPTTITTTETRAETIQPPTTRTTTANSNVKFTIEDVDADADATASNYQQPTITPTSSTVMDVCYGSIHTANTSINSINTFVQPFAFPATSQIAASSASFPTKNEPAVSTTSTRPASVINLTTNTKEINTSAGTYLHSHSARGSSMRSLASDVNDLTVHSYLQPATPGQLGYRKELSSSSCLLRDNTAKQIYSDVTSVRSLASIGIGSSDGRKLVIRKVPQTPNELLNFVNPPAPSVLMPIEYSYNDVLSSKQSGEHSYKAFNRIAKVLPGADLDDDDSFLEANDETANLKPRQQHWSNKMQFVLACIGYSVGLGNVWRFPYMCYKSGGGVFLVPYCIILIVCSIPLLYMELAIGQYTGRGPIGALGQLCPLFKGAGLASVVVSFLMSTYYSVIIAYCIYYFFTSFRTHLPWLDCKNRWNTPICWVPHRIEANNMTAPSMSRTPTEEFFENKILQISPGIEYPGLIRWELFACLICAWLMVYFATWKSIKSSAKVRYFTATFPFIVIIILTGRVVTLEGADNGLRYFFRPNWSQLGNSNIWINAASQNFNSLGITFGSMISFASYNKYNNNILRDTVAVSIVNVLTSLLVGVFAFATIGNLALEQNSNVADVIGDGPGLIFVVYPQAMVKMPYAQLWAVMFFFMLLCLGLNSQFAIVEVVVTSIQDGFPNWIKRHLGYHEILVLFVCVISFLFGLPNLVQGGIYFFQLMDHYAASVTIMFLAFCQMIAVAWLYRVERLVKNVKQMTGKTPTFYLRSCWMVFGPCLLFGIWILSLINYEEPTYHNGRYKYPGWAYGIGWLLASFSLLCLPGYACINLFKAEGNTFFERLKATLRPNIYECKICGEHHCEHDYSQQEQYMFSQEMSSLYKPYTTNQNQTAAYSPMNLHTASVSDRINSSNEPEKVAMLESPTCSKIPRKNES